MAFRNVARVASRALMASAQMAPVARTAAAMAPRACAAMAARGLATGSSVKAQGNEPADVVLANLLDREIQEEQQNIADDVNVKEGGDDFNDIAEKIHARFHVKETEESSQVKLHAKHGNEKILVQFDVQDTTEDELPEEMPEEENPEDYTVGVRAMVTVTKGQKKLIFSAVFTNAVWIDKVAMDVHGRDWDNDTLYWSDFNEYPEDVQEAFTNYLADRHVDGELAAWASWYAYEKEKKHYVSFLQTVEDFVKH